MCHQIPTRGLRHSAPNFPQHCCSQLTVVFPWGLPSAEGCCLTQVLPPPQEQPVPSDWISQGLKSGPLSALGIPRGPCWLRSPLWGQPRLQGLPWVCASPLEQSWVLHSSQVVFLQLLHSELPGHKSLPKSLFPRELNIRRTPFIPAS